MSYQDIERWEKMNKSELYQELVRLYGDMPPIDDLTCIYVNNCYELSAEIDGYPTDYFRALYPKDFPFEGSTEQVKSGYIDAFSSLRCDPAPFFDITQLIRKPIYFLTREGQKGSDPDITLRFGNCKGKLDEPTT